MSFFFQSVDRHTDPPTHTRTHPRAHTVTNATDHHTHTSAATDMGNNPQNYTFVEPGLTKSNYKKKAA